MGKELVRRESLSEQLFSILKEELDSGKYEPGQKLPSESAIAQNYGVSRLTVRAAIARLSALNYIETRTGEGSFVSKRDTDQLLQTISSMVIEPQMLNDVSDFRRLIDTECVRLTIKNASDEDLKQLTVACNDFSNFMDGLSYFDEDIQKTIVDLDFKFHLTICQLSGNLLYPLAYKAAQEAIKQQICTNFVSRWYYNRMDASSKEDIDRFRKSHEALLNAIIERDLPRAKRITASHLSLNVMKLPD